MGGSCLPVGGRAAAWAAPSSPPASEAAPGGSAPPPRSAPFWEGDSPPTPRRRCPGARGRGREAASEELRGQSDPHVPPASREVLGTPGERGEGRGVVAGFPPCPRGPERARASCPLPSWGWGKAPIALVFHAPPRPSETAKRPPRSVRLYRERLVVCWGRLRERASGGSGAGLGGGSGRAGMAPSARRMKGENTGKYSSSDMAEVKSMFREVLPKQGQLSVEDVATMVLCKPKLLPLKSLTLEKLEKMQQTAQETIRQQEMAEKEQHQTNQ